MIDFPASPIVGQIFQNWQWDGVKWGGALTMTYTLTAHPNTIVRDEDGVQAFIPTDPDNVDYQAYLAWCEEGNTAKAYTPPPAVKET